MRPTLWAVALAFAILLTASRESAVAQPVAKVPAAKVQAAQEKGVKYLKGQQRAQGGGVRNWEEDGPNPGGGPTVLALLALLEAGVKADDDAVERGLKYLRTVEPQNTYTLSLQIQVLCKLNQKEDAGIIKRNVKWLVDDAARWRDGTVLEGWSYQVGSKGKGDNSNTRYAIAGLYAAHKAGFKTPKEGFWQAVADYYVRTQTSAGGWTYANENRKDKGTQTMTLSGLVGLLEARDVLGKVDKDVDKAIDDGYAWVGSEIKLLNPPNTFYGLDGLAAVGRLSGKREIIGTDKKREWYPIPADWLVKSQRADGSWKGDSGNDANPVWSTSFALRFLASRPD